MAFVLAQRGIHTHLVRAEFSKLVRAGDTLERDPALYGPDPWTIVKVFGSEDLGALHSLIELMGFEKLAELFKIDTASPRTA